MVDRFVAHRCAAVEQTGYNSVPTSAFASRLGSVEIFLMWISNEQKSWLAAARCLLSTSALAWAPVVAAKRIAASKWQSFRSYFR